MEVNRVNIARSFVFQTDAVNGESDIIPQIGARIRETFTREPKKIRSASKYSPAVASKVKEAVQRSAYLNRTSSSSAA